MPGLHQLHPNASATRKRRRVGRGDGSNRGSYSGRGSKGQLQTGKVPFLFEGGQLPLVKRLPHMRGFNNIFRVSYTPVNVASLNVFEDGDQITPEVLYEKRLVRKPGSLVKLLGDGEIDKRLVISVHAFSDSARQKIEAAGGEISALAASDDSAAETDDHPGDEGDAPSPESEVAG